MGRWNIQFKRFHVYAGDVAEATDLPLLLDIDTGFGGAFSIARTIKEMIAADVAGKDIKINWDTSKPNGEPKRKMNTEKQEDYGLLPKIGFEEGIRKTYEHYKKNNE